MLCDGCESLVRNVERKIDILFATPAKSACNPSNHRGLRAPFPGPQLRWPGRRFRGSECMMKPKSSEAGALSVSPQSTIGGPAAGPDLPVAPSDLEKLARWVPKKEMALLVDLCERAQRDPDLARPALLLCSAYAKGVARMLDQDPFPTVTRRIAERLRQIRVTSGL